MVQKSRNFSPRAYLDLFMPLVWFIRGDIMDKVLLRDLPSLYGISDVQELNKLLERARKRGDWL